MKILFTGFDPFGGESLNPSWEAVRRLPERLGEASITKLLLPTLFDTAAEKLLAAVEEQRPDAVICVGQAAGRSAVSFERVAINLRDSATADNSGRVIRDEPICPGGSAAYFSTFPVKKLVEAVNAGGIPAAQSLSAGSFVCNELLYRLLRSSEGSGLLCGFVHVPALPEQLKPERKLPSMELDTMVRALELTAEALL